MSSKMKGEMIGKQISIVSYLSNKIRQVAEVVVDALENLHNLIGNIGGEYARDEIAGDNHRLNMARGKAKTLEEFVAAVQD